MPRLFRIFLSSFIAFVIIFVAATPVYSESAIDYETQFREMDIEELQETSTLLLQILNEKKVANAKLFLDPAECTLAVGKTMKLSVTSDEREITSNTQISFESSDESIAVIKNGTVSGKAPGTSVITVTAIFEDGAILQASSSFTIVIPVSAIKTISKKASVLVGNELDITSIVSITPEDATEKGLVFSIDDDSIATVSEDGKLKGVKAGSANITITSTEKTDAPKSASIAVTVNQPVTNISLNTVKFDVGNKNKYQLSATLSPNDATDKTVTWESLDPKIASVSKDGTVTGVGTGTTTIVCTANDGSGVTASAKVTVITAINRLTLNQKELVITKGKTATVGITITPANPTNKKLIWTSSKSSVAEVSSNGSVTAVSEGECLITAKTTDGTNLSVSIPVYVEPENPVVIESISWRTSWGRRTGQMAVYATSKCHKRTIKSFDYTVFCVKETEYIGNYPFKSGWTTDLTFSKPVKPGQKVEGPMESVSGFGAVDTVEITPTKVYFSDGTVEDIPSDAQYTSTFTVY